MKSRRYFSRLSLIGEIEFWRVMRKRSLGSDQVHCKAEARGVIEVAGNVPASVAVVLSSGMEPVAFEYLEPGNCLKCSLIPG